MNQSIIGSTFLNSWFKLVDRYPAGKMKNIFFKYFK